MSDRKLGKYLLVLNNDGTALQIMILTFPVVMNNGKALFGIFGLAEYAC